MITRGYSLTAPVNAKVIGIKEQGEMLDEAMKSVTGKLTGLTSLAAIAGKASCSFNHQNYTQMVEWGVWIQFKEHLIQNSLSQGWIVAVDDSCFDPLVTIWPKDPCA